MLAPIGFISMPGGPEWIVIGIIGLLIFGKKLPDVARSLGKSVVEFKKGLHAVEDEIEKSVTSESNTNPPNQLPPS